MNTPVFDLLIRNARLERFDMPVDIGIAGERIAAIGAKLVCEAIETTDAQGAFASRGFTDSHVHLDKACILDRCSICEGTLAEAISETAKAKAGFTEQDVYARAARVVEKAIVNGTMRMRTFAEIDPRAGMRSFEAIKQIRQDYAFAIDIEICAFAQDGLTNEPRTLEMLDAALADGANLVGGAPYIDPDPRGQIRMIFDLAEKHGTAIDFHLDFDLSPEKTNLPAVIEETVRRRYQGRVSLGHMTSLSAMAPEDVQLLAQQLKTAGIAVTVLPSTDLFLNGRGHDRLVPRGVAPAHLLASEGVLTSIANNNILNPFTPYGDASLLRMANLYANVAQLSRRSDMQLAFEMISTSAARIMGRDEQPIEIGSPADIILIDSIDREQAIRENARVIFGCKRGRRTFEAPRPSILRA